MARISNTLCNPTPFEVKINWHQGINILLKPDDEVELTVEQMDDFRDGKPGYEAVRMEMDHEGVFLRDPTRTYESQALVSLRASLRSKKSQYDDAVSHLRRRRAAEGISENQEALDEIIRQQGYSTLQKKIELLRHRIDFLGREVEEDFERPVHEEFDPDTTVILPDGTFKKFQSKVALAMFLSDPGNEPLKAHHEKVVAEMAQGDSDDSD